MLQLSILPATRHGYLWTFLAIITLNWSSFVREVAVAASNSSCASFMGYHFTGDDWDALKATFHCIVSEGRWAKETHYSGSYRYCALGPYRSWYNNDNCSKSRISEGAAYSWETIQHRCHGDSHLTHFHPHNFCHYMDKQNILIVGDSLSAEFTASLMNAVYPAFSNNTLDTNPTLSEASLPDKNSGCNVCDFMCHHTYPIQCHAHGRSFTISNYRSDRLDVQATTPYHDKAKNFHHLPWTQVIHEQNIALLILNRGAHFADIKTVLAELEVTFDYLLKTFPHLSIIFRNTAMAHANAQVSEKFFSSPANFDELFNHEKNNQSAILGENLPFGWGWFTVQNEAIRELIYEKYPRRVLYMDVATATQYRADSHCDSLHYCISPGPIDTWIKILYNAVKLVAEKGKSNIQC